MNLITKENIHIWNTRNPFHPDKLLVSIEDKKQLYEADNKHKAVEMLFILNYPESAKELMNAE